MGVMIEVDGFERLQMGGGICQAFHGACSVCGKEFHWSLSEKAIEELLRHVLATRKDSKTVFHVQI